MSGLVAIITLWWLDGWAFPFFIASTEVHSLYAMEWLLTARERDRIAGGLYYTRIMNDLKNLKLVLIVILHLLDVLNSKTYPKTHSSGYDACFWAIFPLLWFLNRSLGAEHPGRGSCGTTFNAPERNFEKSRGGSDQVIWFGNALMEEC